MSRKLLYFIALVAIFALGIFAGRLLEERRFIQTNRLGHVLRLIEEQYVDSVNMDSIQEGAIPLILGELDPHSTYLSAEMSRKENEGLNGSFEGIGVLFYRHTDTIVVTRVIDGGASQRAGLQAGDRILRADTTSLIGADLTDHEVMSHLKGPSNSVVKLLIRRDGQEQTIAVVRGPVPVSTLDAAYMVRPGILYIRINKWGGRTHQEVLTAYARHLKQEVKGLIIDLRDNSGGYLEASLSLAGEFLKKGQLILYAEGRAFPRENYINPKTGLLVDMPLVVLVNEFSASASEIFAGVMQDHDRATIVGRRTFGKGLVQQPFILSDSSVVRLTVARYYTPSGRSVQKSYAEGNLDYAQDLLRRLEHGELHSADSISDADSARYYTTSGRVVHAAGGITPDIFVPRDTTGINPYYTRLLDHGMLARFSFDYADKHRKLLSSFESTQALNDYLKSLGNGFLFEFAYYAQARGVAIRTTYLYQSANLILTRLRANIADQVARDTNALYEIAMEDSPELLRGVDLIEAGEWNPIASK
ncbi:MULTISPECIES: S41 family peptidase [unclassified Porphyromonas]|uniref:S41 family peptidase n=1 Tax=unclassified Porphyromonas TaxID=2645799 RepID=UPI00052E40BD|nr:MULTISPECIES: S41 family peptidase [unclassified Porphyromonas]KGN86733.1 peptidase S41 [Porphyromonas sp. COT-290 OH860]KGO01376.1 peptidase S41 [Porphyromonas sp. COT-290 OH3588]